MPRPKVAANLPPLPKEYERQARAIRVDVPPKPKKPLEHHLEKNTKTLSILYDKDFDPKQVKTSTTYHNPYVHPQKAKRLHPLSVIPCNCCWNHWAIAALFSMPKYMLVEFFRGVRCPGCWDSEDVKKQNHRLMTSGPSYHWVTICQSYGMQTFMFPYLNDKELHVGQLFNGGIQGYSDVKEMWNMFRPIAQRFDPNRGETFIDVVAIPEAKPEEGDSNVVPTNPDGNAIIKTCENDDTKESSTPLKGGPSE